MTGVPIPSLCCPTCGEFFASDERPLVAEFDQEGIIPGMEPAPIKVPRPVWITCPLGHRWSIKALTRSDHEPDEVLLGDYLGGGSAL